MSAYVAASRVDGMPDQAPANSVVIHGAFLLLKADGHYTAPQCGYMYFQCRAGDEAMCRLQWKDIATIGTGSTTCAGFGTLLTVTSASIRTEGTALASPDAWDLGMGVSTGIYVDGQCPAAKALVCPPPPGNGGSGGTTGAGGATGVGGTIGTGGSAGTTGGAGATGGVVATGGAVATGGVGPTGGTGGTGGAGTTGGAGATGGAATAVKSGGSCTVAADNTSNSGSPVPIVAALAAAAWISRRRR